uniref:Uncharacterized protein n=1 Tax=Pseudo-nitzschia multistriata TaxID=183589 RepID=A0A448ZJZ4_9STRA
MKRSAVSLRTSFSEEIFTNGNSLRTNSRKDDEEIHLEGDDASTEGYPWSKVQEWALRDNLPKYTVRISKRRENTGRKKVELSSFVLWRTLRDDIPELCGYPVEILRSRHEKMEMAQQSKTHENTDDGHFPSTKSIDGGVTTALGVLPFLQDYEFSTDGGMCGYVYGLDGLSDGSRIETSQLKNVKETLPRGFIQTSDDTCYELGQPLQTDLEGVTKRTNSNTVTKLSLDKLSEKSTNNDFRSAIDTIEDPDGLLLRLGATTGILLAGATAFNMVSHHLTVNVFWV